MFLMQLQTQSHNSIYVVNSAVVILDDITERNKSKALSELHSLLSNTNCDAESIAKKLQSALIKTGLNYNVYNVDDYCIDTDSVKNNKSRYYTVIADDLDFELELINTLREEVFFAAIKHIQSLSFEDVADADNYLFNYTIELIDNSLSASDFFNISEDHLRIMLLRNEQHWQSFEKLANAIYKQKKLIKRGQK